MSAKSEREMNEKLGAASDKSKANETLLDNFRSEVRLQLRKELSDAQANCTKLTSDLK